MNIRCCYYDDQSQNVFSIAIILIKDNKIIARQDIFLGEIWMQKSPYEDKFSFEAELKSDFDYVSFMFEEQSKDRPITIKKSDLSSRGINFLGINFKAVDDPYDEPTYAGEYEYMHPEITSELVRYDTITPEKNYVL